METKKQRKHHARSRSFTGAAGLASFFRSTVASFSTFPSNRGRSSFNHRNAFSGPIVSIVPPEARGGGSRRNNKPQSGYRTPEPSSPKVSCIGQIKRSGSRRQKKVNPCGKNGGARPPLPKLSPVSHPPPPLLLGSFHPRPRAYKRELAAAASGRYRARSAAVPVLCSQTLTPMPHMEGAAQQIAAGWFAADSAAERPGCLPRSGSSSRLNAQAPEFVPRGPPPPAPPAVVVPPPPQVIRVFAAPPPPPRAAFFAPPPPRPFEYYAPVGARGGFTPKEQQVPEPEPDAELLPPAAKAEQVVNGLEDEVVHKITKQVEYYFSDINLATTEHLMRFITKDPEGYVPISVIAGFKKVKASVRNNFMLAEALRSSSKLVVSDDGKRVKRREPFTESDLQELKSRIVVAENLPGDPSYQNLKKIFSAVGSVISIRTCYPQAPNGSGPATNRSSKLDMLFSNKLHAFVEYETPEDAEKAIVALSDEENWRNGLRVRLLNTCSAKGAGKGKNGTDGNGEEDFSYQSNEKQSEETSQLLDVLPEHLFDETFNDKEVPKRGKGRGRGGRGRGRGNNQYNNHHHHHSNNQHHQPHYNNHGGNRGGGGAHPVGTPPHNNMINKAEQHQQLPIGASKLPPGPRMPDGSRGFTMGRGKPQAALPVPCAVGEAKC